MMMITAVITPTYHHHHHTLHAFNPTTRSVPATPSTLPRHHYTIITTLNNKLISPSKQWLCHITTNICFAIITSPSLVPLSPSLTTSHHHYIYHYNQQHYKHHHHNTPISPASLCPIDCEASLLSLTICHSWYASPPHLLPHPTQQYIR